MADTSKHSAQSLFRMDLDADVKALPGRGLRSLLELFAHLERSAALRERSSRGALENQTSPEPGSDKSPAALAGPSARIGLRQLGRGVLSTTRAQVRALLARTHQTQALIVINDWRTAGRLWSTLLNDCKLPIAEIDFLEQLWGLRPDRLEVNGWTLTRHRHHFVLIRAEIEIQLARRRSLLELSDAVERHLGDWLVRFGEIIDK